MSYLRSIKQVLCAIVRDAMHCVSTRYNQKQKQKEMSRKFHETDVGNTGVLQIKANQRFADKSSYQAVACLVKMKHVVMRFSFSKMITV